ncbi:DUF4328 domain-containing protein [Streptomyces brevispora]|uniref:DUF4328 domain-containing protein n=1 Tax=Streptomyces brevispora TaxID=887462 RepID=UPI0037F40927
MLCSTCRTRPPVTADGRCTPCAQSAGPAGVQAPSAPVLTAPQQWPRSPDGLAKAVVVLLLSVVVADLLAVASDINIRSVLGGGIDNDFAGFDDAEADRADMFYAGAGVLQLLTTLATAVGFIMWFRRVRANAEIFDASAHSMRPGWAVGGWFVPVAGLWLPRRIAGGIWVASAQTNTDGTWRNVSHAPLNLWWGAWVASLLFGRYASQQYDRAELPQEIMDAASRMMVSDLLDIVAAVFAILFVRKLTRMQGERAAIGPFPLGTGA